MKLIALTCQSCTLTFEVDADYLLRERGDILCSTCQRAADERAEFEETLALFERTTDRMIDNIS